jgi:hypothetical protein
LKILPIVLGVFTNVTRRIVPILPTGVDTTANAIWTSFQDGHTNSMALQDGCRTQTGDSGAHNNYVGLFLFAIANLGCGFMSIAQGKKLCLLD